jgi:tripeptidyl-peptidase-1
MLDRFDEVGAHVPTRPQKDATPDYGAVQEAEREGLLVKTQRDLPSKQSIASRKSLKSTEKSAERSVTHGGDSLLQNLQVRVYLFKSVFFAVLLLMVIVGVTLYNNPKQWSDFLQRFRGRFGNGDGSESGADDGGDSSSGDWVQPEIVGEGVTDGWLPIAPADVNDPITLHIAVKQQNVDAFHDQVYQLADPKSPLFLQHMSYEEVHEWLKPSDESVESVVGWLRSFAVGEEAIEKVSPNGDYYKLHVNIGMANALLNTEYWVWQHTHSGANALRVKDAYFVPRSILKHIDFISPTVRFPMAAGAHKEATVIGRVGEVTLNADGHHHHESEVTPQLLSDLYHANEFTDDAQKALQSMSADADKENYLLITAFLNEHYADADLSMFMEKFGVSKRKVVRYPDTAPDKSGSEGTLDIEYGVAMSNDKVSVVFWECYDDSYFVAMLHDLFNSEYSSKVTTISISYGADEQDSGKNWVKRSHNELAKGAAMGITFFSSSGDDGANDAKSFDSHGRYQSQYPATDPYVTAIGGTVGGAVKATYAEHTGETAWSDSGGGFSVYLKEQKYQKTFVKEYFESAKDSLPPSNRYSKGHNGMPTLSCQSVGYAIARKGFWMEMSGTSAAAPAIAGMFSVISADRIARGLSGLGWLNPVLYQLASEDYDGYFTDIVEGQQAGPSEDSYKGYPTAKGWDAVTGLGTPKFPKLYEYLLTMKN